MDDLGDKVGETFLAEEKGVFRKERWGCSFICKYSSSEWLIETPGFCFLKENAERPKASEKISVFSGFLVQLTKTGDYELVHYFPGGQTEICYVPKNIKKIRKGSFCKAASLKKIIFRAPEVVLEEGAFLYLGSLTEIEIPNSRRYKVVTSGSQKDRFLVDSFERTILYYLPTETRMNEEAEVLLWNEAKRIGEGAFTGKENVRKIWLHENIDEIGGSIFDKDSTPRCEGRCKDDCRIRCTAGGYMTMRELRRKYSNSTSKLHKAVCHGCEI